MYEPKLQDIEGILGELARIRVMIVGDVMLDRYCWGGVTRISPEAPVPVVLLDRTTEAAGGAANVAANVVGLGAKAVLVGLAGDDPDGDRLADVLAAAGIDPASLERLPGHRTTVKTRIVAHGQQIARLDQESVGAISAEVADGIGARIASLLGDVDAVIVSDYAKGFLTPRLLGRILESAREARKPVFVDPKGKDYSKYRGATMLTPNQKEAAEACGLDEHAPGVVAEAGRRLLAELGMSAMLVTEGERGMSLFSADGGVERFPSLARAVYDVTGAGDTVIATLAATAATGLPLSRAAEIANAAAGLVVEQVGTTAITSAMLRRAASEPAPGSVSAPRAS